MLLPADDAPSTPAGLFAVTFRNRSAFTCTLSGVIPRWIGDNESSAFPYSRGADHSDEARLFKSAHNQLAHGEQVHMTFGWPAVPGVYQNFAWGGCSSYEDLAISLERNGGPNLLRTHHLWLRSCGGIWALSLRAGPFLPVLLDPTLISLENHSNRMSSGSRIRRNPGAGVTPAMRCHGSSGTNEALNSS